MTLLNHKAMLKEFYCTEEEMAKLAQTLANLLPKSAFLALDGDLGTGKTTFAQGLIKALGVEEPVISPTFNLLKTYTGLKTVHHLDLYRLDHEEEVLDLGWWELLDDPAIVLVEWQNKFPNLKPQEHLQLLIKYHEQGRVLQLSAQGEIYEKVLEELIKCVS